MVSIPRDQRSGIRAYPDTCSSGSGSDLTLTFFLMDGHIHYTAAFDERWQ
jgi:hypothetical protein